MNLRTTRWSTLASACRRNNTCRLLSIDTNLIVDKDMFFDFRPKRDKKQSDFLESLANCRVDRIGDDIDVIRLNKLGVRWKCLGPQKLFVRQFYADLLNKGESQKCSHWKSWNWQILFPVLLLGSNTESVFVQTPSS